MVEYMIVKNECPECKEAKKILSRYFFILVFLDIESEEAKKLMLDNNIDKCHTFITERGIFNDVYEYLKLKGILIL